MEEDKFTEFEKILMDIVKEAKEEPNEEYDFTSLKIDADCLISAAKKELEEEYILIPRKSDIQSSYEHEFEKGYEVGKGDIPYITCPAIDECLKAINTLLAKAMRSEINKVE